MRTDLWISLPCQRNHPTCTAPCRAIGWTGAWPSSRRYCIKTERTWSLSCSNPTRPSCSISRCTDPASPKQFAPHALNIRRLPLARTARCPSLKGCLLPEQEQRQAEESFWLEMLAVERERSKIDREAIGAIAAAIVGHLTGLSRNTSMDTRPESATTIHHPLRSASFPMQGISPTGVPGYQSALVECDRVSQKMISEVFSSFCRRLRRFCGGQEGLPASGAPSWR